MTLCTACRGDITDLVGRQRAKMIRKRVDSFPFACPHCAAFFMLDLAGGATTLVLQEEGTLRTPSLLDAMFGDPEIREGLLDCMLEEGEEDEEG